MKRAIILFIILFTAFNSIAQENSYYYRVDTIPVYQYGRKLLFPWVGGLNSPQFSAVTLDSLGVSLLVAFDRSGNHFYTFLNRGITDSASYLYAPQYEINFPACNSWALLRDYNYDGVPDIFSSISNAGVDVYRGFYNAKGEWDFKLAKALLEYPYATGSNVNIYVANADLPAIDDVDGDSGMDILAFGVNGGYIYDYKNISDSLGYGYDSLIYSLKTTCWLNIEDIYHLSADTNTCGVNPFAGSPRSRHAGNTLCTFDEDSSGNKSAIWGGVTFPYSVFFHNQPNDTSFAFCNWMDTTFPGYGVHDSIRNFPAAYSLDVNNDGYSDLLFAPNYSVGSEDYDNVRYYRQIPSLYGKTGTRYKQHYQYEGDSLFSKDMIDVGSGSSPAFFHYFNNDTSSIYDLVVGSEGMYSYFGIPNGCLTLYRNTGTAGHPSFQLVSKDFASISNLTISNVVPTFGDLRGKGTEDMILGNSTGTLYYFENRAAVNSPAQYQLLGVDSGGSFYDSISVGGDYSAPQLVDVDGDGLLDLLVGCGDGTIYYYHNDGTATAPKFKLVSSNWGNVYVADTSVAELGYSHPFLYRDSSGKFVLLVGSYNGTIFRYNNIDNNLNGNFTLTDNMFENINTGFETYCTIAGAKLLGNANPELAVGNYRGGLSIYTNSYVPSDINLVQKPLINFKLYPNPANNAITISLSGVPENERIQLDVEDMLGRTLISKSENYQPKMSVSISQLPAGLYFCRVQAQNYFVVNKFVITR